MERRFIYNYALLNEENMCRQVLSSPKELSYSHYMPIPSYNEEYLRKYYIDGTWFEKVIDKDEEGNDLETFAMVPWPPETI